MILMHLFASFQWSLSSSRAVFILLPTSSYQPSVGTGGISPQAQPCLDLESERAKCSNACAALSPPDEIKCESWCPKHGTRSIWPLPQVPCAPLNCRFLSAQLWMLVLPADSQPTWPQAHSLLPLNTNMPVSTSCFNSLAMLGLCL